MVPMVPCTIRGHFILFHKEDARSNNPQGKLKSVFKEEVGNREWIYVAQDRNQ